MLRWLPYKVTVLFALGISFFPGEYLKLFLYTNTSELLTNKTMEESFTSDDPFRSHFVTYIHRSIFIYIDVVFNILKRSTSSLINEVFQMYTWINKSFGTFTVLERIVRNVSSNMSVEFIKFCTRKITINNSFLHELLLYAKCVSNQKIYLMCIKFALY